MQRYWRTRNLLAGNLISLLCEYACRRVNLCRLLCGRRGKIALGWISLTALVRRKSGIFLSPTARAIFARGAAANRCRATTCALWMSRVQRYLRVRWAIYWYAVSRLRLVTCINQKRAARHFRASGCSLATNITLMVMATIGMPGGRMTC